MRNATFILLTATLLAGSALGAPAPPTLVTTCPYFIHTAGSYQVDADLSCSSAVGIAIMANNVDLDLKGHTITGAGTGVGIGTLTDPAALAGTCVATKGIHIHGGSVTGFLNALVLCSPGNVTGNTQATVD